MWWKRELIKEKWPQAITESMILPCREGAQKSQPCLVLFVQVHQVPSQVADSLKPQKRPPLKYLGHFVPKAGIFINMLYLPKPASSEDPGSFAIDFNGSIFGPLRRPF